MSTRKQQVPSSPSPPALHRSAPPPPPPGFASPSAPDQPETVRGPQSPARIPQTSLDAFFDLEALRERIASGARHRMGSRDQEPVSAPLSDVYRHLRSVCIQAGEGPRRCYCGNADFHKLAGAPLWICSTCHPPARGARIVERATLDDEEDCS